MRRLRALSLFTVGYMLMALLSPAVAALPALAAFAVASLILLTPEEHAEGAARQADRR